MSVERYCPAVKVGVDRKGSTFVYPVMAAAEDGDYVRLESYAELEKEFKQFVLDIMRVTDKLGRLPAMNGSRSGRVAGECYRLLTELTDPQVQKERDEANAVIAAGRAAGEPARDAAHARGTHGPVAGEPGDALEGGEAGQTPQDDDRGEGALPGE